MSNLFSPLKIKDISFPNRIGVSPMCMYSYQDGYANQFQGIHLGSRALGGAGLVIAEATAVEPRGRITPYDVGIWSDDHIEPLKRTADAIKITEAVAGIQIAHSGRKGSTQRPSEGGGPLPTGNILGWQPIGPSPIPFADNYQIPYEMSFEEIHKVQEMFVNGAERAYHAGFQFLEIHAAHGYLLHSFYSPLSNHRSDRYGGVFENRIRFTLEVVQKVRKVWPESLPLCVRISGTDWVEGGWSIEDSIELAKKLMAEGVDLIDCSSAGLVPNLKIPTNPGYQVFISKEIRKVVGIQTATVGLVNDPLLADQIIRDGEADIVLLGRELLRNPTWPIQAAINLGFSAPIPFQYQRGY